MVLLVSWAVTLRKCIYLGKGYEGRERGGREEGESEGVEYREGD